MVPAAGTLAQCHIPDWLRARRAWGLSAQLYELRSGRNHGIGDFEDLGTLCEIAARAGADFIGLNPLHALFLAEPDRCSPFSPSNRRFLNPLYIAIDRVEGYEPAMVDAAAAERLRGTRFVDYAGVARLKLDTLRRIWRARPSADDAGLQAFRQQGGAALERHAAFEAIALRQSGEAVGGGWKAWPRELSSAEGSGVEAVLGEEADAVSFHCWLQWLARRQLAEVAARARAAGMRIGLYLDLAVGEAPDGSATWSAPELMLSDVHVGAPPDVFSEEGQDWGLAPMSPERLSSEGLEPYRALLRAALRDAGALRLDHAMALKQLFFIPAGRPPAEGRFVAYPMRRMMEALAEISRSEETIVIGEDLGHVPEGFRVAMAEARILSYRILYFERNGSRFIRPAAWPSLALACLSTHDLPTLRGWWSGSDVALRLEHGLIDAGNAARQTRERAAERRQLLRALAGSGLLPRALAKPPARPGEPFLRTLAVAAHRYIARTPSRLASVRLADAVGEAHPTNLPGVADAYPNWRRRLDPSLESLAELPLFRAVTTAMAKERPR